MGIPSKLKNFNLFGNGNSFMGIVAEATIPKFALKMEEWRGGGMIGPIMLDMGLEKLEMDFTLGGLTAVAFRDFGAIGYDTSLLRFAGAYQEDGSGAVQALEIICHGRYQEIDLGQAKAGSDTTHKYKLVCSYVKLTVDGTVWAEIDLVAGVYTIFGVDRYAQIRAALGL